MLIGFHCVGALTRRHIQRDCAITAMRRLALWGARLPAASILIVVCEMHI
jgi:hypothetical protein